jgi:hypothetical protein
MESNKETRSMSLKNVGKTLSLPPIEMRKMSDDDPPPIRRSFSTSKSSPEMRDMPHVNTMTRLVEECSQSYRKVEDVARRMELDLTSLKQCMGNYEDEKTLSDEIRLLHSDVDCLLKNSVMSPRLLCLGRLEAAVTNSQLILESIPDITSKVDIMMNRRNKNLENKMRELEGRISMLEVYTSRLVQIEILVKGIEGKIDDIRDDIRRLADAASGYDDTTNNTSN